MHHPLLKLASVLGIAGICILVILQIQRGLMNADQTVADASNSAVVEPGETDLESDELVPGEQPPSFADADVANGGALAGQVEPAPFPHEFPEEASPRPLPAEPADSNPVQLAHSESSPPFPEEAFPEPAGISEPEPSEFGGPAGGPGIDFRDAAIDVDDNEPAMQRAPAESGEDFNPEPEPAEWPDFDRADPTEPAVEEPAGEPADSSEDVSFGPPLDPKPELTPPQETPAEAEVPASGEPEFEPQDLELGDEGRMPGPALFGPEEGSEPSSDSTPEPEPSGRELPPFGIAPEPQQPAEEPEPVDFASPEGFGEPAPFRDEPELVEPEQPAAPAMDAPELERSNEPVPPSEGPTPEAAAEPDPFPEIPREDLEQPIAKTQPVQRRQPELQPVPAADNAALDEAPSVAQPEHDEQQFSAPVGRATRPVLTLKRPTLKASAVGQPLIYHILVKNTGTVAAHDVVVRDQVPEGVTLTGTIPQAVLSDERLFWRLGTLEPGDERKISLRVIPQTAGSIASNAEVRFSNDYPVATQSVEPALHVDIDVVDQTRQGETVAFRFVVSNRGNADAKDVRIRHVMPQGLQHRQGRDLEYVLGNVPAGDVREAELVLLAAQAGRLQTRTIVTADENVEIERTTSVNVAGQALVIQRLAGEGHIVGQPTVVQNRVINQSGQPVLDATVIEILPVGLEFVSASDGGQYNPQTRTIAWPVGRLEAGSTKNLKLTVVPKAAGVQTSVIRIVDGAGQKTETTVQTNVRG